MSGTEKPLINTTSSDKQSLLAAFLSAQRDCKLLDDNCLPAIVISFDRVKNIAKVKPLIKWIDVNDGVNERSAIADVNVLSLGGGGFHISFPLKKNDLGWIIATDRDISLFKQSLSESPPNTGRLHSFSDSWFVPDVFRQYTIAEEDSNSLVIQSTDGATRISIREGIVTITAPTSTKIDSPLTTITGNVVIEKNLTVNMNIAVDQNAHISGKATIDTDAVVAGKSVKGHGHISSSPGNRTAGGMIS